jgi:hypothetical protein
MHQLIVQIVLHRHPLFCRKAQEKLPPCFFELVLKGTGQSSGNQPVKAQLAQLAQLAQKR